MSNEGSFSLFSVGTPDPTARKKSNPRQRFVRSHQCIVQLSVAHRQALAHHGQLVARLGQLLPQPLLAVGSLGVLIIVLLLALAAGQFLSVLLLSLLQRLRMLFGCFNGALRIFSGYLRA